MSVTSSEELTTPRGHKLKTQMPLSVSMVGIYKRTSKLRAVKTNMTRARWAQVSMALLGNHVIPSMHLELQNPCYQVDYLQQYLLLGVPSIHDVTLKALMLLGPQKALSKVSCHPHGSLLILIIEKNMKLEWAQKMEGPLSLRGPAGALWMLCGAESF